MVHMDEVDGFPEGLMNAWTFNLDLLSNKFYEFFWRSPGLFLYRLQHRLNTRFGWSLSLTRPETTNALVWVREAENFHTRIYIFNYWTEHYNFNNVSISWELRNQLGEVVARDVFAMAPRESKVIEVSEWLRQKGIASPFIGSLHFERNLGPGYGAPLRALQEFYGPNFATAVHEYGTVANYKFDDFQIGVSVWPDDKVDDIEIGILNCNNEEPKTPQPLVLELYNRKGEKVSFPAGELGRAQVFFGSLNAIYPGWRQFLMGEPGNMALRYAHCTGRPLIFHRYQGGISACLNHLTGDKSRSPYVIKGDMLKSIGLGPIWCAGFFMTSEVTPYITLIMNWGFHTLFELEGQLFDQAGNKIGSFKQQLRPWETLIKNLADHIPASLPRPFVGSIRLAILPAGKAPFIPYSFDANLELVGKGWRAPFNLGSSVVNIDDDPRIKSRHIRRSKNFIRARSDESYETYILITNHSSDPRFSVPSDTTLRIISQDGKRESTRKISIPAWGSLFQSIEELFPDASTVFGSDPVVTVHFRDPPS